MALLELVGSRESAVFYRQIIYRLVVMTKHSSDIVEMVGDEVASASGGGGRSCHGSSA